MCEMKYVNWIVVTFKRFDLLSISGITIDATLFSCTVDVKLDGRVYSLWLEPS